jgi:uncharacterized membrane protein YkvA (DUF1232 family)
MRRATALRLRESLGMSWPWIALAAALGLYLAAVLALLVVGRREHARALAGFVPDCIVLISRLVRDPCVPRRRAVILGAMLLYFASPIDLVPDFIPGLGQLDDAILLAVALRIVMRGCDRATVERHWPGPPGSLAVVLRLSGAG